MTINIKNEMNKEGSVITFYSYKGGVGRTMALANLACLLARKGKKVLLIDWDLEAPGLHHFFNRREKKKFKEEQGLIDLITDVKSKLDKRRLKSDDMSILRYFHNNLSNYISKDLQFYFENVNLKYKLDLMKSGRFDSAYTTKLNKIDWLKFYEDYPSFFRNFAYYLESIYDYILIDSRTGFADTSGICTMLMPERLVLVFSPNEQNIEGVLDVAVQSREYRLNSYDERTLAIFPLPARIDPDNPEKRIEWLGNYTTKFEKFFKKNYYLKECSLKNYFEKATIRYTRQYAYGETIPVLVESITDKISIAYDYDNFLNILLSDNPIWELSSIEEISKIENDYFEYLKKGIGYQTAQEYEKAIDAFSKAIILNPDDLNSYYFRGSVNTILGQYEKAISDYSKIIYLFPNDATAYFQRGTVYGRNLKNYELAIKDFNKSIELSPNYVDAYNNRGLTYSELKMYEKAIDDYNIALKIKPNEIEILNNRGIAFKNLQNYQKAITDYTKVIHLNPTYAETYYNRGLVYDKLKKYKEAISDYDKAIYLKPDNASIYNNRGIIYYMLNKYDNALEDFNKSIELEPDKASTYYNRGILYYDMKKYDKAVADYKKALELNPNDINTYIEHTTASIELKRILQESSNNPIELAKIIRSQNEKAITKSDYLKSTNAKDDMFFEWNNVTRSLQDKYDVLKNNLLIDYQKTTDGYIRISLTKIYILVQFYPHFEEYQVSCTFNEIENLRNREVRYKFKTIRMLFDINDMNIKGWQDNGRFYTSEELADYLLTELIKINERNR